MLEIANIMDHRNPFLEHDVGAFSPRNLGTFTMKAPGTSSLPPAVWLVPKAITDKKYHSIEYIATFQSIILHLN